MRVHPAVVKLALRVPKVLKIWPQLPIIAYHCDYLVLNNHPKIKEHLLLRKQRNIDIILATSAGRTCLAFKKRHFCNKHASFQIITI